MLSRCGVRVMGTVLDFELLSRSKRFQRGVCMIVWLIRGDGFLLHRPYPGCRVWDYWLSS